jgi:hypothetical protein
LVFQRRYRVGIWSVDGSVGISPRAPAIYSRPRFLQFDHIPTGFVLRNEAPCAWSAKRGPEWVLVRAAPISSLESGAQCRMSWPKSQAPDGVFANPQDHCRRKPTVFEEIQQLIVFANANKMRGSYVFQSSDRAVAFKVGLTGVNAPFGFANFAADQFRLCGATWRYRDVRLAVSQV